MNKLFFKLRICVLIKIMLLQFVIIATIYNCNYFIIIVMYICLLLLLPFKLVYDLLKLSNYIVYVLKLHLTLIVIQVITLKYTQRSEMGCSLIQISCL
ncbi:uncharacterized protein BX663DRAFT_508308 [Cokeromyces recurvatus]|uniref:uncharacterized protein n=1 Tax=Cokeromyces recurvatus TaxID=90255 RepID=UPI0022206FDD|nr:uncharacterized protein BX663DRAFT_508308 [Cokeromyces recurvatus]KAI7903348.1 hypothetical protein BX663DRAFT_508308 [Cokeromyces recurvatus]